MAIVTPTTVANVLRTVYEPRLSDIVFQNNTLFQLPGAPAEGPQGTQPQQGLFQVQPSRGGTSYNWPVRQAVTDAVTYSVGQAAPAPGNNTYLAATLAYSAGYFWRSVEIANHTVDALRDEGAIVEAIDREVMDAARSIQDVINTTFMGTSHLQLAVDSAGTYAGINRSTYSNWGSWENNLSGAMSLAALRDMVEGLMDNDRGARREDLVFIMPVNQVSNYDALAGGGAGVPIVTTGGGPLDLGFTGKSFQGIPIFGVPDLTNTVVMLVHRPTTRWIMHRPLTITPKATAGDSQSFLITCALQLAVEQPNLCAKQTAVTA